MPVGVSACREGGETGKGVKPGGGKTKCLLGGGETKCMLGGGETKCMLGGGETKCMSGRVEGAKPSWVRYTHVETCK